MDLRLIPRPLLQQRMTPQLIALMRLLARPGQELRKDVLEALDDNPALEEEVPVETRLAEVEPAPPPPSSDERRLLEYLQDDRSWRSSGFEAEPDDDDRRHFEPATARSTRLADHLLEQLREEFDDRRLRAIGEWIIGNLDEGGYLAEEVASIAEQLAVEPGLVAGVLHRIQTFDPVGVAARDARQCLLIQARVHFPDRPQLLGLIEHHLPALRARQYPAIARALGLSVADVLEEEKRLIRLSPRPARGYGADSATPVVPDVYIVKDGHEYRVQVNDDGLPKLRVSPYCRTILQKDGDATAEELAFVRERVSAAKWLINSIYTRQQTIRRVTEAIVARQRDFLDRGREHLRPMVLRDVAGDIGMSESTVSRVTSGKYADTPQGVVELKFFFGAGFQTAAGRDVAAESVKSFLRRLLSLEDSRRPLSDAQIMARLRDEHGVAIARRTVAKYREELGIESSGGRRRRG